MSLSDDLTRRAALDPTVSDDVYLCITRALRGLDPITGESAGPPPVRVLTDTLPVVDVDLAAYRDSHGGWEDRTHHLAGYDGPDADGNVVYVGPRGYRHDQIPHLVAWLTAAYRAATDNNEDQP